MPKGRVRAFTFCSSVWLQHPEGRNRTEMNEELRPISYEVTEDAELNVGGLGGEAPQLGAKPREARLKLLANIYFWFSGNGRLRDMLKAG